MGTTAGVVRTILVVDIVAMALLAIIYLRQRRMSGLAFLCWGVLAICVPILGPFLVLSKRPGEWDPTFSVSGEIKHVVQGVRRLLPELPDKDMSRLERARKRKLSRKKD